MGRALRSRLAAAVLASGGVESAALLAWSQARYTRVVPLYIRTGMRWERVEYQWLQRVVAALTRGPLGDPVPLDLPVSDVYGEHWSITGRGVPGGHSGDADVYLPGRNIVLLSKAAIYAARSDTRVLLVGSLKGNPFPDATPSFFRAMARSLSQGLAVPLAINAPFRRWHKADVIRRVRETPWHLTFSCLRPVGLRHCGRCNKCAERARAFLEAGVPDPTRYARAVQG